MIQTATQKQFIENPVNPGTLPLCLSTTIFMKMWKQPCYIYGKIQDIPCIPATIIRQSPLLRINIPTRMIKKRV